MYTLPLQCEFLSDQWLEETRNYLSPLFAQSDIRKSFTLSECFSDAPPHLGFSDDKATWQLKWDGSNLHVGREFMADADIVAQGDYQATLQLAQTVGASSDEIMNKAMREMTAWYGQGAFSMEVTGEIDEAAVELLKKHHDHMARRTVENPDLQHRAVRQGLTQHIRDMEENGYAVIENAISPQMADELRSETQRALSSHDSITMHWMQYQGDVFEKVVVNPQLMTLIDASLGRGAIAASITAIIRGPGKGMIPVHTDYASVPEPYPEFSLTGVGVWAMEDWTEASGPTWLVPGSHKFRRPPKPGEKMEGVPIEMPKGSVVYFQHGVWHWQGDRTEPGKRITLHSHFNRGILRPLEPIRTDVQLLHRNPPRLGEALGQDDWFDKITPQGRDHLRFAHMNSLNHFTNKKKAIILEGSQ